MEEIFNTELGRKILALTKASFRVADLISDHIIREKIKRQVLNVFLTRSYLVNSGNYTELIKEIDALDSLFYLAGYLNLAKDEHVKALRNGFLVFKSHIILANSNEKQYKVFEHIEKQSKEENPAVKEFGESLSSRQEKILKKFPGKDVSMKLADFVGMFPGLSKRTVRNDLAYLIKLGKILREGQGSSTLYKLL
jgi:hypothetical protein